MDTKTQYAKEKVVKKLIDAVKQQMSLGINQVVLHKEFYEEKNER